MLTDHDPAELPQASQRDDPADHFLEAYCGRCGGAVDAVCPDCGNHVEPSGARDAAKTSWLDRREFYRRFVDLIQRSRNSKFTLQCYLIATGDAYADGKSMTDVAKAASVTKAAVSKECNMICAFLQIPPSQYMRDEDSKESFRNSNYRPKKISL